MSASPEWPDLAWVPPASFSPGRPAGPPRFIVVHYTAGSEGPGSAEAGAAYDRQRTDGTSAHYYADSDSVVQCVRTTDRAHTALYHGNLWGIHYELCGTRQSREQWLDGISRATIRTAARQMARDMAKYGIPNTRTTDVRNPAARGITGHVDWTKGWPEDGGDHIDPGPEFPWDVLLSDIGGGEEEDMTPEQANQLNQIFNAVFKGGGSMGPAVPAEMRVSGDGLGNSIASRLAAMDARLGRVESALAGVSTSGAGSTASAEDIARAIVAQLRG